MTTTALAPANGTAGTLAPAPAHDYTRDQIELLKRTVAPGIGDDELSLAIYDARRRGLDLLAWHLGFLNDERWAEESPEWRYTKMLGWVRDHLVSEEAA